MQSKTCSVCNEIRNKNQFSKKWGRKSNPICKLGIAIASNKPYIYADKDGYWRECVEVFKDSNCATLILKYKNPKYGTQNILIRESNINRLQLNANKLANKKVKDTKLLKQIKQDEQREQLREKQKQKKPKRNDIEKFIISPNTGNDKEPEKSDSDKDEDDDHKDEDKEIKLPEKHDEDSSTDSESIHQIIPTSNVETKQY